ncbi:MAG: VWA domain-containing protein [bacterium]|nr:VWA domain-containing protein [Candidatus Minthenecus merdequi]
MKFHEPQYLWFLLILIPLIIWYVYRYRVNRTFIQVSSLRLLDKMSKSYKQYLIHSLFVLRCLAIFFIILALARPQTMNSFRRETTEGIDIMLALDISGTMLAEDLKPNRLEAAKDVAIQFAMDRPNDNIGLVVFAGESFTQCPLTIDHVALVNLFKSVEYGMIEDGTAIGLGLANAINRIKESKAKSKVIILLTDGSNNRGDIAPITAAEIAKTYGIRVYTIGAGSKDVAPYPFQTPLGIRYQNIPVEIDEEVLSDIATMTGGAYFRATNSKKLSAIYDEIDKMEKTKLQVTEYSSKSEDFLPFLLGAFLCLFVEVLLRHTLLKRLP